MNALKRNVKDSSGEIIATPTVIPSFEDCYLFQSLGPFSFLFKSDSREDRRRKIRTRRQPKVAREIALRRLRTYN